MKTLVSKSLVCLLAFGLVNMASASVIHHNCATNVLKINWLSKSIEQYLHTDISSVSHEWSNQNWLGYSRTNAGNPDALANNIQSFIDTAYYDLEVDYEGTGSSVYSDLSFVNPEREIVPRAIPVDISEINISVPEPGTFGLVLLGLLGLGLARKRMSKV